MRGRVIGLALGAMLMAGACGRQPASGTARDPRMAGTGDAALKPILSAYVVEFLRRNPTTNTYLGGAGLDPSLKGVDGTLRDPSAAAIAEEDAWLDGVRARLQAISADSLSDSGRIDRDVTLAQITFLLRQHQVRRYQERALDTYTVEPFRAVDWQLQGMSQTGAQTYGTGDEWTLTIQRVKAIPQFLSRAQGQLIAGVRSGNVPDRRMIQRDGLGTPRANATYFGTTLPALGADRIGGPDRDALLADLRLAGQSAADAYVSMGQFVLSTYFEADRKTLKPAFAVDRFAMGEAEYDWAVRSNFRLDTTAARLYEEAWPIVEATRQEMVELARGIAGQRKLSVPSDGYAAVRGVFDELGKDYPRSDDEMVAWYRDAAVRLVEYGRKTGMFDVPADYRLDVTQTPPPLEASIDGAAYYPAPPFKNSGVGRFYVTPTHNDRAALMDNNRAALADLSAHEGFPGHDWYFKVLTQHRDRMSPVRWLTPGAVEDSSAMWQDSMPAEGWGLYAEALMAEPQPGMPNGFYTPEERLYQLKGKLYRDLRVRIDTGIHTGRLAYDSAVDLFSEVVDFLPGSCAGPARRTDTKRASCEGAERAIFRYSKWPTQAITYRLGKDQIYALRHEAEMSLGERFSPKTFHLAFIRQGQIPSGYFREALLREVQDLSKAN